MKERGLRSFMTLGRMLQVLTSTTKEAPVSERHDRPQVVAVDLHRRRTVLVRMTRDGEQLGWRMDASGLHATDGGTNRADVRFGTLREGAS